MFSINFILLFCTINLLSILNQFKITQELHILYLFKYFFKYPTLFAISSFPNIFNIIYRSGVFVLVVAITRIIVATSPTCPK